MSIFRAEPTPQWAGWVKSRSDAKMASISNKSVLGKATSLPCGRFRPISSPFWRLEGVVYGYTA
ncbi:MAG: hypothetical protein BGP00_21560 [Novosphingobium sp. 63-713]|nr:MAG: hypothetical protein BGP00_21560 [Novosphingobium sp. 63-713]